MACALGVLCGCKSGLDAGGRADPVANRAASEAQRDNDQYDGWLADSLLHRNRAAAGSTTTSAAPTSNSPSLPSQQQINGTPFQTSHAAPSTLKPATIAAFEPLPGIKNDPKVQQASASFVQPNALNSLTDGPTQTLVTPAPSLPAELPAPPPGSVSIDDIKIKEEQEQEKKGFEWADLAPEAIYKNVKKKTGFGPDKKLADSMMAEGKRLFAEKKYKEAAEKFQKAADRWPDSNIEEDALFLWGESAFFADRYPAAHDAYGGLLKKYAHTRHLDTVMMRTYAIARYWEQVYEKSPSLPTTPNLTDKTCPVFDTFGWAMQAYDRIRISDHDGPLADDSVVAMGDAYFRRGMWEEASDNYDRLCKEYTNSKYLKKAHLLNLRATMCKYQGSAYDETPLKDSEKIARSILSQLGRQLTDEERAKVNESLALVINEQANREYLHAKYYEREKRYGAARKYYSIVVNQYPMTPIAQTARADFEKIRELPDEPAKHFNWLLRIFGPVKD